MRHGPATRVLVQPWPRWWRMVVVALSTLFLCSCQAARQSAPLSHVPTAPPALPQQAFTGVPDGYAGAAMIPMTDPMIAGPSPVGPWAPPGLAVRPWPQDEYLLDGGDREPTAAVREDWEIRGLNVEDTVGHFDTVDGRRLVAPGNQVAIYSPRFGAVRQVVSLRQNDQRNPWAGLEQPVRLTRHDDLQIAASSKQYVQAEADEGRRLAIILRTKQGDGAVSGAGGLSAYQDKTMPWEAPLAIRQGILEESEMAWLAHGIAAANAWSHADGLQVIIDRTKAAAEVGKEKLEAVYAVDKPPTHPRLRVIKVASTQFAAPGETIEFTIRFDNVGDEVIGNVTLVDNLTTRLEYVPESADCPLPHQFSVQPNEAGSLVLRWEISDPLPTNEGGVIRFQCRVR